MPEPTILNLELYENDLDDAELDRLTYRLCREISDLDVMYAKIPHEGEPPEGTKGDPITIGTIVVALASAGVFTGLIEVIKAWALRREGRTITIKAEANGRKLEITFPPAEASEEEMAVFVKEIMSTLETPQAKK